MSVVQYTEESRVAVLLRAISIAMRAYILLAVPVWIGLLLLLDFATKRNYF